jgi:hypothetical protein
LYAFVAFTGTPLPLPLLFNYQPDALVIQILFCHKTLRDSGIFSAPHREFSTVHSALANFMQVLMTASQQSQDGTGARVRDIRPVRGSGDQKPA